MQRNWIGKSEGVEVNFPIKESDLNIEVFTTRADTLFGATFLVVAPEHEIIKKVLKGEVLAENKEEIEKYVSEARKKSELERTDLAKEKTGVEVKGLKAINPISGEEVSVWVGDYVLGFYGKGAIMSVPAHDERDYEMAKKHNLEIREVIKGGEIPYAGEGEMINSEEFSGMSSEKGKEDIVKKLEKEGRGKRAVNYKLGDWVFSRQRYWGEPIPLVHCKFCGTVPLKEEDLPLTLPEVERYEPTGTGESPLKNIEDWIKTECPKCRSEAIRETNTMPQWAGSCWYYLSFIMKGKSKQLDFPASIYKDDFEEWLPVDLYVGGAEHAVLHLLYARFWHKFLYDIGVVSTKEPFHKLKNQGLIMGEGGIKMSKSKGNVISPDEVIEKYGADVLRLYEMFLGGFDDKVVWSEKGVSGMKRFLEKVAETAKKVEKTSASEKLENSLHRTIKKVTQDLEGFKFNTAISALMNFNNEMRKEEQVSQDIFLQFIKTLAPFAPHFSEELWSFFGEEATVLKENWPEFDEGKIEENEVELVIQVNGKVRDTVTVSADISKEEIEKKAKENEKVKKWTKGKEIKKVVIIKNKIINIVTN